MQLLKNKDTLTCATAESGLKLAPLLVEGMNFLMYAVIATGGKQYKVKPHQTLKVGRLPEAPGATVLFDKILFVSNDNGETIIGTPYTQAKVEAKVLSHGRHKKISIIKLRRRKHHLKRMGHRQDFTEIKIDEII